LRRGLAAQKLRVTQATAFARLQELRLIKRKKATNQPRLSPKNPRLCLRSPAPSANFFSISARGKSPCLKTPPSGAQPLAAAMDGAKFAENRGTVAGDDTVLIITPNKKSRESLQKRLKPW